MGHWSITEDGTAVVTHASDVLSLCVLMALPPPHPRPMPCKGAQSFGGRYEGSQAVRSFSQLHCRVSRAKGRSYSLALPQGVLHAVPAELLVVIDEGEGQGDVQRVGAVRGGRPFAGLERNHQVHPGGGALDFELLDEVLPENLTQELFKFVINS